MGGGGEGGSPIKNILSGTVAGFAQVAAGHPLDTIKVRLQTQSSVNPEYAGMADAFRKTMASEGITGLYAGASSPLLGAMAHNAGVFFCHGMAKQIVGGDKELTVPQHYLAGSLAAIPITIVEAPIDLFKIKLQADRTGQFSGLADCGRKVWAQNGIRGIYQGGTATVLRNVPCFGGYFCAFEATKKVLTKPGEQPSLGACFVAGGAAGFGFWGVFYPLETMKTRMQGDALDPAKRLYKSVLDCFRKTMAEGGLKALYKGYTPSIARAVPVNAAIFTGFTAAKRAMGE